MIINNEKIYNILKWIAITALPAIVVFLGVVLPQLGCQCTETVLVIVGAVDTLLGSLLGIGSVRYANANKIAEEADEK